MRLTEAEGKALLGRHGIPLPRGVLLAPVEAAAWPGLFLKAQVLEGGRGRRGLVRRVTPDSLWAIWAAARGVELPARVVSFESTSLAIQAALQGIGLVIAAPMLVEEEVRTGRLVALDPAPVETEDDYWLLLPLGRVRPDAVLFAGWLMREISLAAPG